MLTPFAVASATGAVMLALDAPRAPVLAAVFAGVLYAHGHGVHLAANSIHNDGVESDLVYFLGRAFLAHRDCARLVRTRRGVLLGRADPPSRGCHVTGDAGPGGSRPRLDVFTSTVEGQTWWLELAAAALFGAWALRAPRPLLRAAAGAFALGAALIAVWAIWHGGVPEFSAV